MTLKNYRVIVTASRTFPYVGLLHTQLGYCLETALDLGVGLVVVHGHCPDGGDRVADDWAQDQAAHGMPVSWERHPAQNHPTQDFGRWPACGPRRNKYVVSLGADKCIAVIGPCTSGRCARLDVHGSHGASGCADEAERAGIRVKRFELWK